MKYAIVDTLANVLCTKPLEAVWKLILEHVAKLSALTLYVHTNIFKIISNHKEFSDYFKQCNEELSLAKDKKYQHCWVSLFDLLVDSQRKLKNYAGNQDLVENFNINDCLKKFPLYGFLICKKVTKGIKRRKMYNESTVILSNCSPVFKPNHLILRDVLDCVMNIKDLAKLNTHTAKRTSPN